MEPTHTAKVQLFFNILPSELKKVPQGIDVTSA